MIYFNLDLTLLVVKYLHMAVMEDRNKLSCTQKFVGILLEYKVNCYVNSKI